MQENIMIIMIIYHLIKKLLDFLIQLRIKIKFFLFILIGNKILYLVKSSLGQTNIQLKKEKPDT